MKSQIKIVSYHESAFLFNFGILKCTFLKFKKNSQNYFIVVLTRALIMVGLVVSVLEIYSKDLSLDPAEVYCSVDIALMEGKRGQEWPI